MLSKEQLEDMARNLDNALTIVKNYRDIGLNDLGEDDGFEYMADGICGDIYDAFESLGNAVDGVREIIGEM